MMKISISLLLLLSGCFRMLAQNVGIGTTSPHSSALLEMSATSKGILLPRMTSGVINAIPLPAKGLMVFDTTTNNLMVNVGTGGTPNWKPVATNSSWSLRGNTGTIPGTHFIGTLDGQPLLFRVNNKSAGKIDSLTANTLFGYRSGESISSAISITAIGFKSLQFNTSGSYNSAAGSVSLYSNTTGSQNTAFGYGALFSNTTQSNNTALGFHALLSNSTGEKNTAGGSQALMSNTTGINNTAFGHEALKFNNIANNNSAFGNEALRAVTSGYHNTAVGHQAADHTTSGGLNVAVGTNAFENNTTGFFNTAVGVLSLASNIGGHANTAIGSDALRWTIGSSNNTMVGEGAGEWNELGWNNTFVGCATGGNAAGIFNSVAVGNATLVTASNQARIGNSSTTSIGGFTGWSNISDGRYKKNIREEVKGLDFIMKLRPVTYQLDVTQLRRTLGEPDEDLEVSGMASAMAEKEAQVQTGFIAQEVEQAAASLGYEFSGVDKPKNENDLYALRYAEFVVPLVKAVQEQQAQIEELMQQLELVRIHHEHMESGLTGKN